MTLIRTTLMLTLLAASGAWAQDSPRTTDPLTLDELRTFTDVFNQIRTNYVDEISERTLLEAAIEGMVQQLDPWSDFMNTEEFRQFSDTSEGRYGGIGVRVEIRDRRLYMEAVTPGGPAAQAGILRGDLLLAVDGVMVRGRRLGESMNALLGEPGSTVQLRLQTPGEPVRELTLTRDYLAVPSVFRKLVDGDIGLLHVTHFTRHSHEELRDGVDNLEDDLGRPLSALIIDLRGNPGGVIKSAVEIADGFLDEGLIVYTRSRYEPAQLEFRAEPGQWGEALPLALLVDSRTASAAEVLTGALKDHGRAVIIGSRTFGKGSIQSLFSLRSGAGLKLTTAHYFTPSGNVIQDQGIAPDVEVTQEILAPLEAGADEAGIATAVRVLREEMGS